MPFSGANNRLVSKLNDSLLLATAQCQQDQTRKYEFLARCTWVQFGNVRTTTELLWLDVGQMGTSARIASVLQLLNVGYTVTVRISVGHRKGIKCRVECGNVGC